MHRKYDNAGRRVSELCNAAAGQLRSDRAPVRLAALYTLERLADDNPGHRQSIVNIICSYLRTPDISPGADDEAADHPQISVRSAAADRYEPDEERRVRLTAQRLLGTHLRPGHPLHWDGLSLDLSGATLLDFNLVDCTLHTADFAGATFSGDADFTGTTFSGNAYFAAAVASGDIAFRRAIFSGAAIIGWVWFRGAADFTGAAFRSNVIFREAIFSGDAAFTRAAFCGEARFGASAVFEATVDFEAATVADRHLLHAFPAPWRIEPAEGAAGRLVRATDPRVGTN